MWNKGKTNHKKISNPSCHYPQLQSCRPPSADANFTLIGKWSIKYRNLPLRGLGGLFQQHFSRLELSEKKKKKGQALSKGTTHHTGVQPRIPGIWGLCMAQLFIKGNMAEWNLHLLSWSIQVPFRFHIQE